MLSNSIYRNNIEYEYDVAGLAAGASYIVTFNALTTWGQKPSLVYMTLMVGGTGPELYAQQTSELTSSGWANCPRNFSAASIGTFPIPLATSGNFAGVLAVTPSTKNFRCIVLNNGGGALAANSILNLSIFF